MLKLGVIGVGYLGSIHAEIYARMRHVDLVGVADIDAQRAAQIATRCDTTPYEDFHALIDKVDAVSVAVPTTCHQEVAIPYLNAGVHILLEKPVAPDLDAARAIITAASDAKVVLQIGHLERFNAGVVELARRVDQPRFFEATRLGQFVERATDVDVVTDLMIHDIDIVLSLIKSPIHSVSAIGTPVVTSEIDIANARIEFENGAVANFTASRVSEKKFRRLRVFSKNNYHGLDFTAQRLDIVRPAKRLPSERFPQIDKESLTVDGDQPLDAELAHFVQTIENGTQPLVSGEDGFQALRVARLVHADILASAHKERDRTSHEHVEDGVSSVEENTGGEETGTTISDSASMASI